MTLDQLYNDVAFNYQKALAKGNAQQAEHYKNIMDRTLKSIHKMDDYRQAFGKQQREGNKCHWVK